MQGEACTVRPYYTACWKFVKLESMLSFGNTYYPHSRSYPLFQWRNMKKEKLTGSQDHLFLCFDLVLADEHFFMTAIQTLNLAPVLVESLFPAGYYSR